MKQVKRVENLQHISQAITHVNSSTQPPSPLDIVSKRQLVSKSIMPNKAVSKKRMLNNFDLKLECTQNEPRNFENYKKGSP